MRRLIKLFFLDWGNSWACTPRACAGSKRKTWGVSRGIAPPVNAVLVTTNCFGTHHVLGHLHQGPVADEWGRERWTVANRARWSRESDQKEGYQGWNEREGRSIPFCFFSVKTILIISRRLQLEYLILRRSTWMRRRWTPNLMWVLLDWLQSAVISKGDIWTEGQ